MNKGIIYILIIFFAGIFIGFTYYSKQQVNIVQVQQEIKKNPVVIDPIVLQVNNMSLDEKIGQLLIVGFDSQYLDNHIESMIKKYHIGGVNLLGRNVKDTNQVKKLISDLQEISTIPLFIGTDQEGGINIRFKFLKELTPQTEIKNTTEAEQIAFDRAIELKALGVNMNFSPVVEASPCSSYSQRHTLIEEMLSLGQLVFGIYQRWQ